jgi:hypothetical protein
MTHQNKMFTTQRGEVITNWFKLYPGFRSFQKSPLPPFIKGGLGGISEAIRQSAISWQNPKPRMEIWETGESSSSGISPTFKKPA